MDGPARGIEAELVIIYDEDDAETIKLLAWFSVSYSGRCPIRCIMAPAGLTVGEKINIGIAAAAGDAIVFMDDDDVFADDWIDRSVRALSESGGDIVGIDRVYFYEPPFGGAQDDTGNLYMYVLQREERKWVAGGTLCFWKSLWEGRRFDAVNVGYDNNFMFVPGTRVHAHGYTDGFVATIHKGNVSPKKVTGSRWTRVVGERPPELEGLLERSRGLQ